MARIRAFYSPGERVRFVENQRLQRIYEAKQKLIQDAENARLQRLRDAETKAQMITARLLRKADDQISD